MSGIPRVVEASLRQFQGAYSGYVEAPLRLGQLVAVRDGPATVFGVVVDAESGPEDPTRPLEARGAPGQLSSDVMDDEPELRLLLRTRISVVTCGFVEGERVRATLPPTPPPLLGQVEPATDDETVRLCSDGSFLGQLVAIPACDDAVIAATIRSAATSFGIEARPFLVRAGKELARLLKAEPSRLTTILRGVGE
ncbi:hypothetical protein AYO38_02125 [bacterium SCGC AG-212-C10]|nr:hypothetical protein AYO38_02125 [bacterium SCGC AG-212-C10]